MKERPDQERATSARLAALKGLRETAQATGQFRPISQATGKHGAIPQRPPNMPHVDSRPETTRVPRPQLQPPTQPRRVRPRLVVLGAIAAIIAIIASVIIFLVGGAISQSSGPAATTTDFLSALSSKNYDNAYQDLGPAITIRLKKEDFTRQAQAIDQQYGAITNYQEIDGSAKVNNNTESFSYTITRKNKSYTVTLTLQQDQNDNNIWKIVDYGTTVGPI
jgi:hypothetical protein